MRTLEEDDVYRGSAWLPAFYTAPEKGSSAVYKAVSYNDQYRLEGFTPR